MENRQSKKPEEDPPAHCVLHFFLAAPNHYTKKTNEHPMNTLDTPIKTNEDSLNTNDA